MRHTIYYFASFGNFNKTPLGGGQTAARRLLYTLQSIGYGVIPFNRHRHYYENHVLNSLDKCFGFCIDMLALFFWLILKKRRNASVLYFGYAGAMIPFDFMASFIVKNLGFTLSFYLGGGGAKKLYENGTKRYKRLFARTFEMCDLVMLEGLENIRLINEVCSSDTFYLPNFTENGFAPHKKPKRQYDKINLVYFGRINKTKNILLIVDIFDMLCERINQDVSLTIIGGGDSHYERQLSDRIEQSQYKYRIKRFKRLNHTELKEKLYSQHFFIFPSDEAREGHSNALNEAMSFGIIPVISNNNFLPSIVGEDSLVAKDYQAQSYVDIIERIILNNQIEEYSMRMFNRVKHNFVQSVVENKLKEKLNKTLL